MDIEKYCQDPRLYTYLPLKTRQYYDNICRLREKVGSDWRDKFSKFGIKLANAPAEMLEGIFTPQGLEIIGIFLGIDLLSKAALNGILRGVANSIGPEVMEEAAAKALEEGAFFVNSTIISAAVSSAVEEGSRAATIAGLVDSISTAFSEIASVVMIVQILGTLIDLWDPRGYSHEFNADTLDKINTLFDRTFATQFLQLLTSGTDRFGMPEHYSQLPIEYRLDNELIHSIPIENYQLKLYKYSFEYLNSLEYNSDGHAMKPRNMGGNLFGPNVFKEYAKTASTYIFNQNTAVLSVVRNNLLLFMLLFGVIIWLMLRQW